MAALRARKASPEKRPKHKLRANMTRPLIFSSNFNSTVVAAVTSAIVEHSSLTRLDWFPIKVWPVPASRRSMTAPRGVGRGEKAGSSFIGHPNKSKNSSMADVVLAASSDLSMTV